MFENLKITVTFLILIVLFSINSYCQETNQSGPQKGGSIEKTSIESEKPVETINDSTDKAKPIIKDNRSTRRIKSGSNADSITKSKNYPTETLNKNEKNTNKSALTIGILQGGGSLVGLDFERLISDNIGIQFGGGFIGIGAAINYHFKPSINSSFISLTYNRQGIAGELSQISMGPTFVYRGDWFTAQLGLGFVISRGEEAEKNLKAYFDTDKLPSYMLLYSIGFYFDFK